MSAEMATEWNDYRDVYAPLFRNQQAGEIETVGIIGSQRAAHQAAKEALGDYAASVEIFPETPFPTESGESAFCQEVGRQRELELVARVSTNGQLDAKRADDSDVLKYVRAEAERAKVELSK